MLRLPAVVHDQSSPWYSYLRAVYGSDVRLPVNLRRIELFYPNLLPTNTHLCNGSSQSAQQLLPQCATEKCRGWKSNTRPTDSEVRRFTMVRSVLWSPSQRGWRGMGSPQISMSL